jgi:tRNA threonylcarbamoyl adenosine modification protein (Sua5/YciO/YrdC/YwlC family)
MKNKRSNFQSPEFVLTPEAVDMLRSGLPFIFPTDTVYGLGVAVTPDSSPQPLFELKGRDENKAIAWLVADLHALDVYAEDVPAFAFELARRHWPGALTLIVQASRAVPEAFRAQDGSIALRAPAHSTALALIEALGVPVATTSANRQGLPPATSPATLDPHLAACVALVVDGGSTPGTIPSTIISCLGASPRIVREGVLPGASVHI